MTEKKQGVTAGWGKRADDGSEIWDANPVFLDDTVSRKDWRKLIFYPKRFLLYRWIRKASLRGRSGRDLQRPYRILDVGCGTGSNVIDLKKIFGRSAEVVGLDVVRLQVDLAKKKIVSAGVWAEIEWFDGEHIPYDDKYFDAIYTSDVLGHVKDVQVWLAELNRVLRPGGALAMFTESKLGKHAFIRNYLMKRGLNTDPHAEFHISLYSKTTLREFIEASGFDIYRMYSTVWAKFFVHPDEMYSALQGQKKFPILRFFNKIFYWIRKKTHPYCAAIGELYSLIEMLTIGRFLESQGYIVLGRKKK